MTDHTDWWRAADDNKVLRARIAELEGTIKERERLWAAETRHCNDLVADVTAFIKRIAELEGEVVRHDFLADGADQREKLALARIAELEGEVAKLDRDFNTLAQESFSLRAENERLREVIDRAARNPPEPRHD